MARASLTDLSSESALWKAAMELYYDDKVVAAYDLVESNAAAFRGTALNAFRLIEGEARTRKFSERLQLTPFLELEWVPTEVPHHHQVGEVIAQATEVVSRRLQWDHHESVLATILVEEADADWHEARYGYCTDKTPYDKICLPHVSTFDPRELWRVAAHEFAHVVVLNTTNRQAPNWIDEGVACLMEGRSAEHAAARLRQAGIWRTPLQMSGAFGADRREAANMGGVRAAYDQATVLVAYLHARGGDAGIARLLKAFTDHSRWTDLVTAIANRDPAEVALHQAFGIGIEDLFAESKR